MSFGVASYVACVAPMADQCPTALTPYAIGADFTATLLPAGNAEYAV